jgi:hypothetical protein
VWNASEHLLAGLLFDGAGHRMVPTHAAKSGIRYRYYVSLPHLHGESKTASVGSVSRIPATEIEDVIVKSLHEHLIAQKERPSSSGTRIVGRKVLQDSIARVDVHEDHLVIRLKSADGEETSCLSDDQRLSRRPGDPGRSFFRMAFPETKFVRLGSNVARASSMQSPEAAAGSTRSCRAPLPTFRRSRPVKNAAPVRST